VFWTEKISSIDNVTGYVFCDGQINSRYASSTYLPGYLLSSYIFYIICIPYLWKIYKSWSLHMYRAVKSDSKPCLFFRTGSEKCVGT
jgi:hypothetical protein